MKKAWKYFKPSDLMLVMSGAFLFIVIYILVFGYSDKNIESTYKVNYEILQKEKKKLLNSSTNDETLGNSIPIINLSHRVKEASSIGLGLSLYTLRQRIKFQKVLDIKDLMKEFGQSELLPPNAQVIDVIYNKSDEENEPYQFGLIKTKFGIYYIRYSSSPLKFEILGAGWKGLDDGAAFILRVPDTTGAKYLKQLKYDEKVSSAGSWATLYVAPETENHVIPPPFTSYEKFRNLNWYISPIIQSNLTPEESKKLQEFLKNYQS